MKSYQSNQIQHVHPLNDTKEHVTSGYVEGERCWCKPREEDVDGNGLVVIHNSADGREKRERRA